MQFFRQLIAPDEATVDSIIVFGCLAMATLIGMTLWAGPPAFNALSFGSGCATVLGAIGAGKRLRDGDPNAANNPSDTPSH